jgi:hypothetical protein
MDGALPTHLTQFESGKSRAQTGRTVETSGNFQVFCLATNNFKSVVSQRFSEESELLRLEIGF